MTLVPGRKPADGVKTAVAPEIFQLPAILGDSVGSGVLADSGAENVSVIGPPPLAFLVPPAGEADSSRSGSRPAELLLGVRAARTPRSRCPALTHLRPRWSRAGAGGAGRSRPRRPRRRFRRWPRSAGAAQRRLPGAPGTPQERPALPKNDTVRSPQRSIGPLIPVIPIRPLRRSSHRRWSQCRDGGSSESLGSISIKPGTWRHRSSCLPLIRRIASLQIGCSRPRGNPAARPRVLSWED